MRRARFQRAVQRLHFLDPRAFFELLDELGRDHLIGENNEALVDRYVSRLDPDLLRLTDGDRFAPAPIWGISVSPGTSG